MGPADLAKALEVRGFESLCAPETVIATQISFQSMNCQ